MISYWLRWMNKATYWRKEGEPTSYRPPNIKLVLLQQFREYEKKTRIKGHLITVFWDWHIWCFKELKYFCISNIHSMLFCAQCNVYVISSSSVKLCLLAEIQRSTHTLSSTSMVLNKCPINLDLQKSIASWILMQRVSH